MEFENLSASYDVGIAKKYGIASAVLLNKLVYLTKYSAREDGFCWRTAKELEDELGLSRYQQDLAIKKLEEAGIIETKNTYIIGTQVKCKHFRIINKCDFKETNKSEMQETNKSDLRETNKSVNNNKTIIIKHNNIYKYIIEYLNNKIGSKYKYTTKNTQAKIKARINEGFKEEDFITVINNKYEEWRGTEFEKYLRPETLFGTKFEAYLNQKNNNNLPNWFNKNFKEERSNEERAKIEAIRNGTYKT